MRSAYRIPIAALGITILFGIGAAAQVHGQSQAMDTKPSNVGTGAHSHERCELHGGHVTMTKAHHFETVFAPDGVRIYMYSGAQDPLPMSRVSGTTTVKDKAGTSKEVKLTANVPKEGEPVVYFCTMYDSPPQMQPGKCPKCGMNLVPQTALFGATDLSKAAPGSVKAVVHLTGLDGEEKEVTFTQANVAEEEESKMPAPSSAAGQRNPPRHD